MFDTKPEEGFPAEYKGWALWKWTGWKSEITTAERHEHGRECCKCGREIIAGDWITNIFNQDRAHWACHSSVPPEMVPETSQWLFHRNKSRFLAASYPGATKEYRRGDLFDIERKFGQIEINRSSPEASKAMAKRESFERACRLIDEIESR